MSGVAWKLAIRQYYDLMIHTSVTMYWTIATSKKTTTRETRERGVSNLFQTSYTLVDSLLSRAIEVIFRVGTCGAFSYVQQTAGATVAPHQDE